MEIARSKELESWAEREDIQQRMPGFKMGMGFGIHQGWAIECAVGSEFKIDATYLSPHVNMASRLESATKQYGTKILISGPTFELFSQEVQALCRIIDRVTVKGSENPIALYTYDVPLQEGDNGGGVREGNGEIQESNGHDSWPDTPSKTKYNRIPPLQYFLTEAPPCISQSFRMLHVQAMSFYLGSSDCPTDWARAAQVFKQCLSVKPNDGPCVAILKYIEEKAVDGHAPESWKGFRPLEEK
eukprot:CAMPEP_0202853512 /NCGR_PEP_ID=MMETSP1389-20130828/90520_1 /ASSEMBLY_ACC=CAM_ASM_000865 /TAXON_ID=302021 /ORGANISM="Rhodomonas sp., Strain CCMP768" /LENGTH=242 /DNA_ID=CAMNT_0049532061 /DNA_START=1 /DNA_END=729 /DNA_ORIENTATION=-